jgi:Ca2+-binding RTX toxin-like protein
MNTSTNSLLRQALAQASATLQQFAHKSNFLELMRVAFGNSFDSMVASGIALRLRSGDFSLIPDIQVLSGGELGSANGGYAADLDKIFVSSDFLARHDVNAVAELLLEEIGHRVDQLLNGAVDSAGDEGDIFRHLVMGRTLSAQALAGLRMEDDVAVIRVGGRLVAIEKMDFIGTSGDDLINGTIGADYINSGAGADTINAGSGNDTIDPGLSHPGSPWDSVSGGAGNDILIVNYNTFDAIVGSDVVNNGINGYSGSYTTQVLYGVVFSGIERFDITGSSSIDIIKGGVNNDTIRGGAGNDTIDTGAGGNDLVDGGSGTDGIILDLGTQTINLTVDIGTGSFSAGGVTATSIERFDTLTTGSGNDIIIGGLLDDTIIGGAGNDTIDPGAGISNDVSGGAGNDVLVFDYGFLIDNVLIDNGGDGYSGYYGGFGGVVFSGIERFNYTGSNGDDYINGGKNNDTLQGGIGNDTFNGGLGADVFMFGGNRVTTVSSLGIDNISSFTLNSDKIQLSRDVFTAINVPVGNSLGSNFISVANDTFVALQSAVIVYSQATGSLFYNSNGLLSGLGANGSQFAILPAGLSLSASDFIISGNNSLITLSISSPSVNENGANNLIYTFTRDNITSNALTVNYGVGGTATLGTDYAQIGAASFTATTGTVTFAAGATTATVTIDPTTDTIVETNETVALTLGSGAGYTVGTPTAVTGTINNDDIQVTLAVAPGSVNEDGTINLVYTFTRIGVTTNTLTVNYGVGGTATLGTDYAQIGAASFTATTGTVTFAAGATTATVTIDPTTDTIVETNETVALTLASGTGYTVGTPTAITGTINNDDTQVTLAVAPGSVSEDGTINLAYTFTRVGVTTNALTVNYGVGGTATLGNDYAQTGAASFTATTGTVTFAAGATTATVTIDPTVDNVLEANETVTLTLANGASYTLGTTTAVTGTITNDDFPPAISIGDTTIVEGLNGNPTQAVITLSLNKPGTQAITVNYVTSNGTALAGTDYTTSTGTFTFAIGQTTGTISIPILNDNLSEANETFNITLSTPTNATIADSQAIVTITDTLVATTTTVLPALVENLTLAPTAGAINGTGNTGSNVITGNSANNVLAGLDGNDTYLYDADLAQGIDTVNETLIGGVDTINFSATSAAVSINLGLTTTQTVNANLSLSIPVMAIENFIGGTGNDRITGNGLNNLLIGSLGDDTIAAGAGNDSIYGQGGNDLLSGGVGLDTFYYNGALTGVITATTLLGFDTIADFTTGQDKLALSRTTFGAIATAAGVAIGSNFVTVNDDSLAETQSAAIVYSLSSGSLFYNQNGVTAGLGTNGGQFANLLAAPTINAADIIVVG